MSATAPIAPSPRPFFDWLPHALERRALRADLVAGLTGAIVVLPQGVAFATLAGMPPEYGLYSAMIPCIIAALFGSSRLMVTGPANAISLTVFGLIVPLAAPGTIAYVQLVITLTFMVAIWQLAFGLARLGRMVDRIPHSVIVGFTAGAAILIINSQVRNIFGLDWPRGLSVVQTGARLVSDLAIIHWPSLVVTASTIVACVLSKRWVRAVPHMLVGVLIGGTIAAVLGSFASANTVASVDELPGALPPLSAPLLSLDVFRQLLVPSLVMTLLALAEAISIARAISIRTGVRFDSNREIVGQGLANLAGSFFSSYPSSGSFNRSGVNVAAGALTPMSAVFAALLLIALLAFLTPLSSFLPIPSVAGILVVVAINLIDLREFRQMAQHKLRDFIVATSTFALVVTIPLEWAILGGVLLHLILPRRREHA